MQGRTALLRSRAGWGGWLCGSGMNWDHQEKNARVCFFCLSTVPAMTYCRRWSCSIDKLHLFLTREAAQQEVEPWSRIPVSRETITWAWKWSHREDVEIFNNVWASLTEAVGTCISLRLISILGEDEIIGFTYSFAFAFLLPILFLVLILWLFSLSSM